MNGDDLSKVWKIADSFAVLCSIWGAAEMSRIATWATASRTVLAALLNRIESSLAPAQRLSISVGVDVNFLVQGRYIQGWGAWYAARPNSTRDAWRRIWERMPECVPYDIAGDEQRTSIVIHFAYSVPASTTSAQATTRSRLTEEEEGECHSAV